MIKIAHAHYGWFVCFYNDKPIWSKKHLVAKTYESKYAKDFEKDWNQLHALGLRVDAVEVW